MTRAGKKDAAERVRGFVLDDIIRRVQMDRLRLCAGNITEVTAVGSRGGLHDVPIEEYRAALKWTEDMLLSARSPSAKRRQVKKRSGKQ